MVLEQHMMPLTDNEPVNLRSLRDRLEASDEKYRALVENLRDVIYSADPHGMLTYISPVVKDLFGYEPSDLLGRSYADVIHPDDLPMLRQEFECLLTGVVRPSEYRIRTQSGATRWVRSLSRAILVDGQVESIQGVVTDITDAKAAETRLREQAGLLDISEDAITLRDLNQRVLFWNRGAERLYGWSRADALGKRITDLITFADPTKLMEAANTTLATGGWVGEMVVADRQGRALTLDVRWTLVRDPSGTPASFMAVARDVSERKAMEAHLSRAQRLESIGTLASGVAHDLNNLLMPIRMGCQLLEDRITDGDAAEILATMRGNCERGSDIIRQILSFARGGEGRRTLIQVRHLLREVVAILRQTFPKTIEVAYDLPTELPTVLGDATLLQQVFMNLCINARDAMPEGGTLELTAAAVQVDDQMARLSPEAVVGHFLKVGIADTGGGIAEANLEKIFDPFFSTKPAGKGSGLGLATVQRVVREHGGFVTVRTEEGRGTSFFVHIPVAGGDEIAAELQKRELPQGRGECVLLVDDEVSVREIITKTLETHGYRVIVAENGADAVGVFAQHRAEVDAVLTDIKMPMMDGPAAIQAIRRIDPDALIIAMSGSCTREAAFAGSGTTFLVKPFSRMDLLVALDTLLMHRRAARGGSEDVSHVRGNP